MKALKKTAAVLTALMIITAICAIPAMAEIAGDVTYYPLAGYTPGTEDGGTLYSYGGYDIIVYANNTSYETVRDIDASDWADRHRSYYEGLGYSIVTISSSYTYMGGIEYIELSCVLQDESTNASWNILKYTTVYNGKNYEFFYRSSSFDSAGLQGFYNMVTGASYAGAERISIYVNGSQVWPDSDPIIENSRTLVPIRAVAEALGYSVDWDGDAKCVTMSRDDFAVQVMIDSTWITKYVDGEVLDYGTMDVPAKIINSRTYIPLRAVTEAMGCSVDWDGGTRSVFITGGGEG
ncbi:MAG: copper amine oxidase N-terminal domain-containing protein [Clostridia bacterium]|nr:copper amine oxidase N-terminal domain-containing protein [Clostridia bacterium]